jgi:hypothetical protein
MTAQRQSHTPKTNDEYYVLEFRDAPLECCKSPRNSAVAMVIAFSLLIIVPCMILGNAKSYQQVIKYKDAKSATCYGGPDIINYQITPQIYNSSLTYYPATLHFTTREVITNRTVVMTYPTYFERTFADSCVFHSDKTGRNPCDKLVGDVITKYNELRATAKFPCYLGESAENGEYQIIGLAGEQSVIHKYYRLTTVGIVFCVLDAVLLIIMLCVPTTTKKQSYRITNTKPTMTNRGLANNLTDL